MLTGFEARCEGCGNRISREQVEEVLDAINEIVEARGMRRAIQD